MVEFFVERRLNAADYQLKSLDRKVYKLIRDVAWVKLGVGTLLEHFNLPEPTNEEIDRELDKE